MPASTNSSIVVGHLEPGCLEQVGAVDDDAGAGVVGHAVELAVVGARLDQALQQVVAAEVVLVVGEVDQRAGGLERLGLGVAQLDDVGAVVARQRRW